MFLKAADNTGEKKTVAGQPAILKRPFALGSVLLLMALKYHHLLLVYCILMSKAVRAYNQFRIAF